MVIMNDEKLKKKQFDENELKDMLHAATGGWVGRLDYELNKDTREEYVIVRWYGDPRNPDAFLVNVTADSRWAIAKDVMKAVAKRFE